jgi:hypothetical protein
LSRYVETKLGRSCRKAEPKAAPHQNRRRIETASLWQARQPIYRTSVERWRRYEPWLGELRELAMEA